MNTVANDHVTNASQQDRFIPPAGPIDLLAMAGGLLALANTAPGPWTLDRKLGA